MPRFSDPQLLAILRKAARRINRKLYLDGTSSEITVDDSGNITPSNDDMADLVLLQAECMIASREYQDDLTEGGGGILIRDGEQSVDTTSAAVARGTFFNSTNSPCAELKEAVRLEQLKLSGGGKLVW